MCTFSLTSSRCLECRSLGDCLEECQPLQVPPSAPREDAPYKVIVRHCRTRRPRKGAYSC